MSEEEDGAPEEVVHVQDRDVFRLECGRGRGHREIAAILQISHSTVGSYVRRAQEVGVSWPLRDELDDANLEAALYPPTPPSRVPRPEPDWARPRHGGTDALRGLQGRDPSKTNPQALSREGGEESSVGPDFGEAGCQVITVLVQSASARGQINACVGIGDRHRVESLISMCRNRREESIYRST